MKKILILLTLLIGTVFILSSCDNTDIPIDYTETTYVISYFDEDTVYFTQNVNEGENAVAPISPVKDDYTFVYWTLDFNQFSFDIIIENNIELQAKWEPLIEIEPVNDLIVTEEIGRASCRERV